MRACGWVNGDVGVALTPLAHVRTCAFFFLTALSQDWSLERAGRVDKKKLQQQQQEKQQQTEDGGVGEPLECELRDFEEMRRKVCFVDWLVGVFVDVHWTGGRVGEIDRECIPPIGPPKKILPSIHLHTRQQHNSLRH